MSNTRKLPGKRGSKPRMDFTGYTTYHLDKEITRYQAMRAAAHVRITKAGRLQFAALREERRGRD